MNMKKFVDPLYQLNLGLVESDKIRNGRPRKIIHCLADFDCIGLAAVDVRLWNKFQQWISEVNWSCLVEFLNIEGTDPPPILQTPP